MRQWVLIARHLLSKRQRLLHSTRSVVELDNWPACTTTPMMFIEYGYFAVTVTSLPGVQLELTLTVRSLCLRSAAEARTCATAAPTGSPASRETAALRAPARTESVSVR